MINLKNYNQAYLLGRLFAMAERIEDLYKKSEDESSYRGLAERHLFDASRYPQKAFPAILCESRQHTVALEDGEKWEAEKAELLSNLSSTEIPSFYPPAQMSEFFMGYYHQKGAYLEQSGPGNAD